MIIPFDEPMVWSAEPFGRDRQVLLGVNCRLVQLDVIKKGKTEFNEGVGRAPAAKDFADAAALAALGAPSEPPTGPT